MLQKPIKDGHVLELISSASWALVLRVFGLAVAYLFMILASRLFGAEAWGAFTLSLALITFTAVIGRLGVDSALLRLIASFSARADKNSIYDAFMKSLSIVIPISILLTTLIYVLADQISFLVFHKPQLASYFRIASFSILPICIVYLSSQSLRGLKQIKRFVFLDQVVFYLIALVFLLVITIYNNKPIVIVFSYVGSTYVAALIGIFWMAKSFAPKKSLFTSLVSYRQILSIALPLFLASSIQFIKSWIDTLMLGMFMTGREVGVYAVALHLAALVSVPLLAINSISAPKFAESYALEDKVELSHIFKKSTQLIFFTSTPILLLILFAGKTLLGLSGYEFVGGFTALIILSLGQFVNAISGSVGYFLQMTGEQVFFQNITVLTTLMAIILNYILIPWMGLTGAALSTFIAVAFWNIGCVLRIRKKFGFMSIYIPFMH